MPFKVKQMSGNPDIGLKKAVVPLFIRDPVIVEEDVASGKAQRTGGFAGGTGHTHFGQLWIGMPETHEKQPNRRAGRRNRSTASINVSGSSQL
jgi:hypothetical protein